MFPGETVIQVLYRMEVTLARRRLQKHLEPARPLRRSTVDQGSDDGSADTPAGTPVEHEQNITVEQFYSIIRLHTPKQGRISYTREVLCELASSPVAKKKPKYLPEHPIVLEKAGEHHLVLQETRKESL
ncbi:uncharacterized protein C8orf88 homolog isoform X2 [Gadus morhua]|uniref:uncharacterized protein C8orf88 homolog isoform X2 n=1 Tax=Gadus morhua TaxID=8049 RepID=UPI0011B7CC9B|nr:uncharacterized protein C8orf88 homolog isoform X2 [Gadus morhua]